MAPMTHRPHIALNAHLLSGAASYRSAGIHGYLFNTLAHLPAAAPHFDFTVYVGQGDPPADPALQVCRSSLPTANPWVRILWEQALAPVDLARRRPDLFHGMAFSAPLLWGGPAVVTIYDLSFLRYPERLSTARHAYLQGITRASARRARRVIAISESGRAEIHDLLGVPLDRIDVALPGVDPVFRPLPPEQVAGFRERAGLPARFILHVGTLEPRKNLQMLLHAYAALPDRAQVKLVLIGAPGWQSEPFFALREALNLTNDVLLPGYIAPSDLPLWYNAAEAVVYPSVYEGFGLPVVEAMACGTPVVASNTTSLPEAVGPDGLLLPPDDPQSWTDTLNSLLNHPERRAELAARGPQRASRFTWAQTARATVECYQRALG